MGKITPRTLISRTIFKHPADLVRRLHSKPLCILRNTPSWEDVHLISCDEIDDGQFRLNLQLNQFFSKKQLVYRIFYPPIGPFMRIRQERGNFSYFEHEVDIREIGSDGSELIERISFIPKHSWFRRYSRSKIYENRFKRFFAYKHDILRRDLALLERTLDVASQKILISGSSGLIGSALFNFLEVMGHDVWHLVRSKEEESQKNAIYYNWHTNEANRLKLEGFDSVFHLQGESITKRWTKKRKKALLSSRYEVTKAFADILMGLNQPPKAFFCASAIGYYGDTGTNSVNEVTDKEGDTFLAEVCRAWENACSLLKSRGVRVLHLRFGLVLSSRGGALKKLLPLFRLGLGGALGSGNQYVSWIAMEDVIGAMYHLLINKEISGPINLVSPNPITNKEFSLVLAKCLNRPLGPRIPAFLLTLFKGQMASELLLTSSKIEPKLLLESGYYFRFPFLKEALSCLIFTKS